MTDSLADDLLEAARSHVRPAGARSPLAESGWSYIERSNLEDFAAEDWAAMNAQRGPYLTTEIARQALQMLAAQKDAPSFGYQINNYEHCLQAATLALRAGEDEETIVVSLFHDLGFVTCNESHGEFAAAILRPYVSEENLWVVRMHPLFQGYHYFDKVGLDPNLRERYRGHPAFEACCRFCDDWDQTAFDPDYDTLPLEAFAPMVHRLFAKQPKTWLDDA